MSLVHEFSQFLFLKDKKFQFLFPLSHLLRKRINETVILLKHSRRETETKFSMKVKLGQHLTVYFALFDLLCGHLWYICNSKYLMNAFFPPAAVYANPDLWYLCPAQVSCIFSLATTVTNIVYSFNKADWGLMGGGWKICVTNFTLTGPYMPVLGSKILS